jgi:hypothetical protein
MKPDWKDAPEWAQWLTFDRDGWWWFDKKPLQKSDGTSIISADGKQSQRAYTENQNTVEPRPAPETDGNDRSKPHEQ